MGGCIRYDAAYCPGLGTKRWCEAYPPQTHNENDVYFTDPHIFRSIKIPISNWSKNRPLSHIDCSGADVVVLKYMKTGISIVLATLLHLQTARSQPATFDITYAGFTPEAEAAFEYAADIWSTYLISDVPIKVNAKMVFLLPGQLGITFPNGEKNFSGAPYADVWYASCLANAITGVELNPGEADIDVFLNTSANWYFGTDGNPGATQYDFVSTVLHELCHGLGFLSLGNVEDTTGSFGLIFAESFAPLVTSFTWPDLDTLPGAFDMWLLNNADVLLTTLDNPSAGLKTAFTSNAIYLESPMVLATHGESGRIYAPSTFTLGSSLSHWNEGTYPVGDPNEFMTPFAADGHANHIPGPLTLAVLDEIGWEITDGLPITNISTPAAPLTVFPNPATTGISLSGDAMQDAESIQIFSATGNRILMSEATTTLSISHLPAGWYTVYVQTATAMYTCRFTILEH